MDKKVLIIIVTYNAAEYIGACLSSLAKINYPRDRFDILVVDNASTDRTTDAIKDFVEIKLLVNGKNVGFAAGNNIGLKYAVDNGFDYVYLLNQDTEVDPEFLAKAVELARIDEKIAAVQSKLLLFDTKKINSIGNEIHYLGFAFAGGYQLSDRQMSAREITYASGAACLLRIFALKKIGLFNADFFMYHEDADLGWRLWLSGWKVMLAPESVVYHKYEFSRSIKKYYYMERNRFLVILQNYKLATILLIAPAGILMDLATLFYSFFSGWWLEKLKVYVYFLSWKNWAKIIKARRKVQRLRVMGDREVAKRFVGKIDFQDMQNPLLKYIGNPVMCAYWSIAKKLIFW